MHNACGWCLWKINSGGLLWVAVKAPRIKANLPKALCMRTSFGILAWNMFEWNKSQITGCVGECGEGIDERGDGWEATRRRRKSKRGGKWTTLNHFSQFPYSWQHFFPLDFASNVIHSEWMSFRQFKTIHSDWLHSWMLWFSLSPALTFVSQREK